MLSPRVRTRAAFLPVISRTYSTMASALPPQSFILDRNIFNETFYTSIQNFWFAGLPAGQKSDNPIVQKRWWGRGRTEEEGKAFDEECRQKYSAALESIGPEKIALPEWKSYPHDAEHAKEIAAPFLKDLDTLSKDEEKASRLLSMLLLLDQLPRNIHRTPSALPLVYRHYDRLAYTLLLSTPTLRTHALYRGSSAYRMWFALPAMHAEDLSAQDLSLDILRTTLEEAEADGDETCAEQLKGPIGFAQKHREIVERFGRFPHRNQCLGREHKGEEGEWLKTGETFGVKQKQDTEKSEL